MTTAEVARARRVLMRRDPVLAAIIKKYGACGIRTGSEIDIFRGLIEAIVSQQLSTKAAATIHGRLCALLPGGLPTPEGILPLSDEALRGAGLSRQKTSYVRDLSYKVLDGSLQTGSLAALDDEDIVTQLTRIKGIGRWTAEMILIFRLARPDVLPVDDLGIVKAVRQAYGLRKMPDAKRLMKIGECWRPYRSVASWYLWASLENKP
ncbi:MAG: DNA-3-methyladenine glycosylase 2 family protein [Acidobacteria bacterium]|nr:DNA-3-methyladenine glycosylase 2 family protein [Acidobacteriota bacterium]